jgi:hypothetical protein
MHIRPKRAGRRRRRAPAAVILAALLVVTGATVVSALQSEQKAPTPAKPAPKPTATMSRAQAKAALEKARDARRQQGQRPVKDQLAATLGVSPGGAYVTATFATPMPWTTYKAHKGTNDRYDLPAAVQRITFYLELDNGYPFTLTGAPSHDLMGSLAAYLGDPKVRRNFSFSIPDARSLADRAVLLGFSMRYGDFAAQETQLRDKFGLAAAEVVASADAPPIAKSQRLTRQTVDGYRADYAAGRVGRG